MGVLLGIIFSMIGFTLYMLCEVIEVNTNSKYSNIIVNAKVIFTLSGVATSILIFIYTSGVLK